MPDRKRSWISAVLGCGLVALLVIGAAVGIAVIWMLRPAPTFEQQGGTEIVLLVDLAPAVAERPDEPAEEVRRDVMERTVETIRRRADESDVEAPSVFLRGEDRIVVQLPGVTDANPLDGVLTQEAHLEFRMVDDTFATAELERLVEHTMRESGLGDDATDEQIAMVLRDWLPEEAQLLWELERDAATGQIKRLRPYLLEPPGDLTGERVADASVLFDQFGSPTVALEFDEEGKQLFCEMTRASTQEKLAIVVDDVVLSVPVIVEPICEGEARISLGMGSSEEMARQAENLAVNLRAGVLPAPVVVESVTVVGPAG